MKFRISLEKLLFDLLVAKNYIIEANIPNKEISTVEMKSIESIFKRLTDLILTNPFVYDKCSYSGSIEPYVSKLGYSFDSCNWVGG